eukprot:GSMAST32.ASY1.ANO1.1893.1 assembled CDS
MPLSSIHLILYADCQEETGEVISLGKIRVWRKTIQYTEFHASNRISCLTLKRIVHEVYVRCQERNFYRTSENSNDYEVERQNNYVDGNIRFFPRLETHYTPPCPSVTKILLADYARMYAVESNNWRVTKVNTNYDLCTSYPPIFCIPCNVSDETLKTVAICYDKNRFPLLSWIHPTMKTCIYRSAQKITNDQKAMNADEFFITKGASFDPNQTFFQNIYSSHLLSRLFDDVMVESVTRENTDKQPISTWLHQVRMLLHSSWIISSRLEDGYCAHIHCSHGWDRTTQISSLAQLISDPYYRTIKGFQVLIQKEWLAFGHNFNTRTAYLPLA